MISTGELESMQAAVTQSLPDSCAILRRTDVPDGAGGWVPTWATVALVPCRVRPTGAVDAREAPAAERLQGRTPFTVTLSVRDADGVAVAVLETDQIRRGADATALEVLGVNTPESWPVSVRVLAAKVAN